MRSFYKRPELTEEEQELNLALDQHRDAFKDEMQMLTVAGILWFVGLTVTLFSPKDSPAEHIGSGLLLCAVVAFVFHFILSRRTRKYRYAAKDLLDTYTRKKALPFFNELTEMFAKKPGIHLHLNDSGTIVVTDRRKEVK